MYKRQGQALPEELPQLHGIVYLGEDGKFTQVEGSEMLYPHTGVIVSGSQGAENELVQSTSTMATMGSTAIGRTITIDDLFRDGYKSVFIGAGLWKANAMHIKGETLGLSLIHISPLTVSRQMMPFSRISTGALQKRKPTPSRCV